MPRPEPSGLFGAARTSSMLLAPCLHRCFELLARFRVGNHTSCSSRLGGCNALDNGGHERFQEADPGLGTDNRRNRVSPSGSSLAAADLRLAGLRHVSAFPGAEEFLGLLGNINRRSPVCCHRCSLQTNQAGRTERHRWRVQVALAWASRARLCSDRWRSVDYKRRREIKQK